MSIRLFLLLATLLSPVLVSAQQAKGQPSWFTQLPACPCTAPDRDGVKTEDGWAKDKGDIQRFHRGATTSYRSYPPVRTSEGLSAQQCCYNEKGSLITFGRGAGTPDKVSVCKGEDREGNIKVRLSGLSGHYFKDVRPWKKLMKKDSLGWKAYNILWIPDNRNHCSM